MRDEPEEEYQDLSKLRKVLHKSKWRIIQDAIHWINLRRGQDKKYKKLVKLDLIPLSFSRRLY